MGGILKVEERPWFWTGGVDSIPVRGRLLQRSTFKGKEGEGPGTQGFRSFCAWKPLTPNPTPARQQRAAHPGLRGKGSGSGKREVWMLAQPALLLCLRSWSPTWKIGRAHV